MNDAFARKSGSAWSRFWTVLCELEEAMSMSGCELLHHRVSRLEEQVAKLQGNEPRETA
jgi:hypothetical protein